MKAHTTFPLADVDVTKLARYMFTTLGKRRAAVLYINNDTGIDAAKLYRDTFTQAGGEVVTFEAYDPKATEFTGMLLKTRAASSADFDNQLKAAGITLAELQAHLLWGLTLSHFVSSYLCLISSCTLSLVSLYYHYVLVSSHLKTL